MAKAKKAVSEPVRPKMVRPIKPISSYTSTDDLKLIIERARKWGDFDYATLAETRLAELQTGTADEVDKKAARPAKARRTA